MPDINRKLSKVDGRLAKIDRRLGFLKTRLYFQPSLGASAGNWIEVAINNASDSGESPKNLQTGEEIYAHRFSFQVNRLWMERYSGVEGIWEISVSGNPGDRQAADLESQTFNDKDAYASLSFRLDQNLSVAFPPTPPTVIQPYPNAGTVIPQPPFTI